MKTLSSMTLVLLAAGFVLGCHSERSELARLKKAPEIDGLAAFVSKAKDAKLRGEAAAALLAACRQQLATIESPQSIATCLKAAPGKELAEEARGRLADLCEQRTRGACSTLLASAPKDPRHAALARRGLGRDVVPQLLGEAPAAVNSFVASPAPRWPFPEPTKAVFVEPIGDGAFDEGGSYRVYAQTEAGKRYLLKEAVPLEVTAEGSRLAVAFLAEADSWLPLGANADPLRGVVDAIAAAKDAPNEGAQALLDDLAIRQCEKVATLASHPAPGVRRSVCEAMKAALKVTDCPGGEKAMVSVAQTDADASTRTGALQALAHSKSRDRALRLLLEVHASLWKDDSGESTAREALSLAASTELVDPRKGTASSVVESHLRSLLLKNLSKGKNMSRLTRQVVSPRVAVYAVAVLPDLLTALDVLTDPKKRPSSAGMSPGPRRDHNELVMAVSKSLMAEGLSLMAYANALERIIDSVVEYDNVTGKALREELATESDATETAVRGLCRALTVLAAKDAKVASRRTFFYTLLLNKLSRETKRQALREAVQGALQCAEQWQTDLATTK